MSHSVSENVQDHRVTKTLHSLNSILLQTEPLHSDPISIGIIKHGGYLNNKTRRYSKLKRSVAATPQP